jgi:chromosome segregation ATPase
MLFLVELLQEVTTQPTQTGSGAQEWILLITAIGTAMTSLIKSFRDGADLQRQVNDLSLRLQTATDQIEKLSSDNITLRIESAQKDARIESLQGEVTRLTIQVGHLSDENKALLEKLSPPSLGKDKGE